MNRRSLGYRRLADYDDDPMASMANLFDVAMVFAVALMVAVVSHMQMSEIFTQDEVTYVKNPGSEDMEIVVKKGKEIERYKSSGKKSEGNGKKIGAAYQLEDGRIIYIPE